MTDEMEQPAEIEVLEEAELSEYDDLDAAILLTIPRLREAHNACTARAVASTLGASPDVVKYRCQKMRDDGIVVWTDMPGSLSLVAAAEEASTDEAPVVDQSASPLASDVSPDAAAAQVLPPEPSTVPAAAKPKLARKRPAKKAPAKRAPRST